LQKNALLELKEENKLIKLAKEMSITGSEVHDIKIKINELVRDIDRCIDLLNE
jgi:chromosome condensin MukBEF MukE localization factor